MANIITTLFPTADHFLNAPELQVERAVLQRVIDYYGDSMHPMTTREVISNELFAQGAYDGDFTKRTAVERRVIAVWKKFDSTGLIEEPDASNGKNGYRIPSERGRVAAASVDLRAAITRSQFTREMFHPSLPVSAWNAFQTDDYDAAVFEAFKGVEVALRNKAIGKNGITAADYGNILVQKAFDPITGPLTDMAAPNSRRLRRRELFSGAFGELRNPKAHQDPKITDPLIAVEEMMVASALFRIVDNA